MKKLTMKSLLVYIFVMGVCFTSNFTCEQKIVLIQEHKLRSICISTCYVNGVLAGNSSCVSVKTSYLINLAMLTNGFKTMRVGNITSISEKTAFLRVIINYYFRGVMLRALIAKRLPNAAHLSSTVNCWLDDHSAGGVMTLFYGTERIVLNSSTEINASRWISDGKDANGTLNILNERVSLDSYFLSKICPQLSSEIYKKKVAHPKNFSLIKNDTKPKKFLRNTWRSTWSNWYKYKEIEAFLDFSSDYENLSEITYSMSAAGLFFLAGGAFTMLLLLCCLSMITRKHIVKDLGY
uniref:Envelope glycoprotein UL37 n=1 Tax=Human betaherpesvirus 6A TaxID=32603 RepID=A0A219XZ41_9BETA|nr:envelope glycoprotein UL37 [Human betaherpesvirus 6A]AVK93355.1 U18 [Human betaherpesvirus 6A]